MSDLRELREQLELDFVDEPVLWECWIVRAESKQEQIWAWVRSHQGWLSNHPSGVMFWLPSDCVWYLRILDPGALREEGRDYVG